MGDRPAHRQVWTKVNAHVDEGVADLVFALSSFQGLRTLESCQGDPDGAAWVCFFMGEDREDEWPLLANLLLGRVGPTLARELGDLAHVSIHVTGAGLVQGELTVRSDAMSDTVSLLLSLAADWQPRAAYHRCACSCDTSCTLP